MSLELQIAEAQAKLAQLQAQAAKVKPITTIEEFTDALHSEQCHTSHEDGRCSYDFDKWGDLNVHSDKARWLKKAQIIKNALDAKGISLSDAMAAYSLIKG
jgi:hypothetical protein